jgi:2-dehydro-3-deoxygluconokinase
MTELITFGETPLRLSPPGRERLETAREATIDADGTASNAAVAANRLGAEALWLSKLPDTPLGRRVETQLEAQGIETGIAWSDDPTHRQGLTFREAAARPRESRQYHDRANTAAAAATPADFPMERVQNTEIVFAGLGTAVLSQQAAETTGALLRAAGGSGAMAVLDLDYSDGLAPPETYQGVMETLAGDTDLLFANEASARRALDRSGGARELANTIAAEYDLEIVVIVRSDRGAVALRDSPGTNIIHERDPVDVETVEPTGRRGAFVGAFLQQLIAGADTADSLTHAVAAGALARTVPGPFLTVGPDELAGVVEQVRERS